MGASREGPNMSGSGSGTELFIYLDLEAKKDNRHHNSLRSGREQRSTLLHPLTQLFLPFLPFSPFLLSHISKPRNTCQEIGYRVNGRGKGLMLKR